MSREMIWKLTVIIAGAIPGLVTALFLLIQFGCGTGQPEVTGRPGGDVAKAPAPTNPSNPAPPATSSSGNPPSFRSQSLIGYGVVNHWETIDCVSFANSLPPINLTLIEYTVPDGSVHPEQARVCVEAMRDRGILTILTAANWAHDNPHTTGRSEEQNERLIDQIVSVIGEELVVLIPVSEPSEKFRDKAEAMTKYARAHWGGLMALSDFEEFGVRADLVDKHYCSLEEMKHSLDVHHPLILHNTDCSPVLNPGPEKAADLAQRALNHDNMVLIYDYYATQPDYTTIEAMRKQINDWLAAQGGAS